MVLTVSLSFVIDQGDDKYYKSANTGSPFDSHSVTISSEGLGTLVFLVKVDLLLSQL